jgi:hypothetical protein
MFKNESDYLSLKKINYFNKELFAELYGIPVGRVMKVVYFDPAFAVKCTMVRSTVSGAPGDTDIYGAQQHAPLLKLRVRPHEKIGRRTTRSKRGAATASADPKRSEGPHA